MGFPQNILSKNTPRNFVIFSRFIVILLIINNGRFSSIPVFFSKGAPLGLRQFLASESPFINDEKCSLFHHESSFCS